MRLPPFSRENMKLQGGHFDHADRMFCSVADTWQSAAHGHMADVKELTPEFFYLPTFLTNRFALNLGVKQNGQRVSGRERRGRWLLACSCVLRDAASATCRQSPSASRAVALIPCVRWQTVMAHVLAASGIAIPL